MDIQRYELFINEVFPVWVRCGGCDDRLGRLINGSKLVGRGGVAEGELLNLFRLYKGLITKYS